MGDPVRVLAVGDGEFRAAVRSRLERADAEVLGTAPSEDGWADRVPWATIDGVVCEHAPPAVDGLALVDTVTNRTDEVPAAIVTPNGTEAVGSSALAAGAIDCLALEAPNYRFEALVDRVATGTGRHAESGGAIPTSCSGRSTGSATSFT